MGKSNGKPFPKKKIGHKPNDDEGTEKPDNIKKNKKNFIHFQ